MKTYCELKKGDCKMKKDMGNCWCKIKSDVEIKKGKEDAKY